MGLNDGRMGGGRDGSRLMCRQRRSLLCVSEAHKAASVCAGTEGPPFTGHSSFFFCHVFCRFSVLLLVAPLLVTAPCSKNPEAISVEMQPRLALIMS